MPSGPVAGGRVPADAHARLVNGGLALASVGCAPVGTGLWRGVARRLPPARWDPPPGHRTRLEVLALPALPCGAIAARSRQSVAGDAGRPGDGPAFAVQVQPSARSARKAATARSRPAASRSASLSPRSSSRAPNLRAAPRYARRVFDAGRVAGFVRQVTLSDKRLLPSGKDVASSDRQQRIRNRPRRPSTVRKGWKCDACGAPIEAGATAYVYSERAVGRTHTWRFCAPGCGRQSRT